LHDLIDGRARITRLALADQRLEPLSQILLVFGRETVVNLTSVDQVFALAPSNIDAQSVGSFVGRKSAPNRVCNFPVDFCARSERL
jgi:hypothetical protein